MLAPDLERYLVKCRSQLMPFDMVAQQLAKSGWSVDDILTSKRWYLGDEIQSSVPVEKSGESQTKIVQSKIFTAQGDTPAKSRTLNINLIFKIIGLLLLLAFPFIFFMLRG